MQNEIQSFNFENFPVRTTTNNQDNSIWFCLPDVANVLEIQNSRDIVAKQLDKAGVEKIYISYESGKKQVTFINEPNLYRVIFRSNKAEAVKFQNWVFDEVLPSIRKTGQYTAPRQTLSPKEQKALADKVRSLCQHDKKAYSTVWRAIKDHFGVERYQDILASDFEDALAFLDTIAPPSPTDYPFFLSQNMAREFSARLKHIFDLAELVGDNKPAHLMKSRIKELHRFLYEYQKQHYPNVLPALP